MDLMQKAAVEMDTIFMATTLKALIGMATINTVIIAMVNMLDKSKLKFSVDLESSETHCNYDKRNQS